VEFSAALRLPRDITLGFRDEWVGSVLSMLELSPLEHTMVGDSLSGGMSFEQKKRLSIAVELAANPAILFLDEPTTGLDSRSAQVVIRCIRRVASSGRSIVSLTPLSLSPSLFLTHNSLHFSCLLDRISRVHCRCVRSINHQLTSSTRLTRFSSSDAEGRPFSMESSVKTTANISFVSLSLPLA
jgi:ABC-type Mn2+/Zn2+ transport system ATPase subunit